MAHHEKDRHFTRFRVSHCLILQVLQAAHFLRKVLATRVSAWNHADIFFVPHELARPNNCRAFSFSACKDFTTIWPGQLFKIP